MRGHQACDVRFWNVADKRPAVGKILKAKAEYLYVIYIYIYIYIYI